MAMKTILLCIIVHFLLFFIPCVITITAQERTGYVTGEDGVPLDLATVVLFAGEQQAAVAVTDTTGRFLLSVADGEYVIKIRNITYKPLEQMLEVKSGSEELGIFKLEESVLGLDEVVVEASPLTREADRFVMRIANVPSMLNRDVTEVLRLARGVWVDDTGISINGMKGAKVFSNGQEWKWPRKELADYLRKFQSSVSDRKDVMPKFSSEYRPGWRGCLIRVCLW